MPWQSYLEKIVLINNMLQCKNHTFLPSMMLELCIKTDVLKTKTMTK